MTFRTVLITGASGFIGHNLIGTLQNRNWTVYATSRSEKTDESWSRLGIRPVRCDLTDAGSLSVLNSIPALDFVVHLAGSIAGTSQELFRVNQNGTSNLVSSLQKRVSPPVLVSVSSVAAGGPSPKNVARTEDQTPCPVSNYGKSKLAGERVAIRSCHSLPLTIIRPGIVFGPGDKEFILILKAMKRLYWNPMIGLGYQPLSMVDVRDLVRLLLLALEDGERVQSADEQGDAAGGIGIYNASSPEPMTLRELGSLYYRTTGRLAVPVPIPPSIGMVLGYTSELYCRWSGSKSALNRDKIREAMASGWFVSPQKAQEQLGWQTNKSLRDTMSDWIRFCIDHRLL